MVNITNSVIEHGADQHANITRTLFIPADEGYSSAGTLNEDGGYHACISATANAAVQHFVEFKVPDDFVSFTSLLAVWSSDAASGNARLDGAARYGAVGEAGNTHSDDITEGDVATGGAGIKMATNTGTIAFTLASLALGDYVGLYFYRNGAHANDTLDAAFYFYGWLLTYVASQ